jgi:hypothetical protein
MGQEAPDLITGVQSMKPKDVVESVKEGVSEAKSKAAMVASHGQEVVKTGVETLQAAKNVIVEAGRETAQVLSRGKDELKRTLKEGASHVGDKLSRIATPNRREQAQALKAEVKQKKREKRMGDAAAAP